MVGELSVAKSSEFVGYKIASESNMRSSEVEDDDNHPWTTVGRKSWLDQSKNRSTKNQVKNLGLTLDQQRVIFEAERSLMKKECDQLAERVKNVHVETAKSSAN